jgi:sugar lactone lactonase YvrE
LESEREPNTLAAEGLREYVMQIDTVPVDRDLLGESPIWDERIQALYWSDQLGQRVRRFSPANGSYAEWPMPKLLGSIALTDNGNVLLAVLADGVYTLDLTSGVCTRLVEIPQARPGVRLNEGRCDHSGRLIAGSVVTDGGDAVGTIYRVSGAGRPEILREGMVIPNAACFNLAGDRLYYACSRAGVITVRDYEPDGEQLGDERLFVDVRPYGRAPDGATVDAENCVWVALIMSGVILRFRPDGTLDRKIECPAPHPSSIAFGGSMLDTLYVTTVRATGMLIKSDHPASGTLLAIQGLDVRGVAERRFRLSSREPRAVSRTHAVG